MTVVAKRRAEDHTDAFAIALIQIRAGIHKVIGGCFKVEVGDGCVALRWEKLHKLGMVLDSYDQHRGIHDAAREIRRDI